MNLILTAISIADSEKTINTNIWKEITLLWLKNLIIDQSVSDSKKSQTETCPTYFDISWFHVFLLLNISNKKTETIPWNFVSHLNLIVLFSKLFYPMKLDSCQTNFQLDESVSQGLNNSICSWPSNEFFFHNVGGRKSLQMILRIERLTQMY